MVRAVLRDFYHSFFPLPSKFELPSDMRNRFLHISELNNWKESRAKLRIAAILAVVTLCLLTCAVVCPEEVCDLPVAFKKHVIDSNFIEILPFDYHIFPRFVTMVVECLN